MPIDNGATVNLMPYSLFKELEGAYVERIKMNIEVSNVEGGDTIDAKGVASMELIMGNKTPLWLFSYRSCLTGPHQI